MQGLGTLLVLLFSDPMVDVLTAIGNATHLGPYCPFAPLYPSTATLEYSRVHPVLGYPSQVACGRFASVCDCRLVGYRLTPGYSAVLTPG